MKTNYVLATWKHSEYVWSARTARAGTPVWTGKAVTSGGDGQGCPAPCTWVVAALAGCITTLPLWAALILSPNHQTGLVWDNLQGRGGTVGDCHPPCQISIDRCCCLPILAERRKLWQPHPDWLGTGAPKQRHTSVSSCRKGWARILLLLSGAALSRHDHCNHIRPWILGQGCPAQWAYCLLWPGFLGTVSQWGRQSRGFCLNRVGALAAWSLREPGANALPHSSK